MVILITGASHTGKTLLAQRLLEKHAWPYLSIDHLKIPVLAPFAHPLGSDEHVANCAMH